MNFTTDLDEELIAEALDGAEAPDAGVETEMAEPHPWPVLDEAALYGYAGEFVRIVEPHTEADPTALLIQFLVAAGNVAGRVACRAPDGRKHFTNLFAVLPGKTGKSRKGSSYDHVSTFFDLVDYRWRCDNTPSGLSSGEGLIWAVRDRVMGRHPIKHKGRVVDYEEVEVDPGVTDKRVLVVESEFASTLKVMARDGNTLSATIRQAWDSGNLRILTKNSPARATDAHISIIAHITIEELLRCFDSTEMANGFGNRFLFDCVRRSKLLPRGGRIDQQAFRALALRVKERLESRASWELEFGEAAYALWDALYPGLSAERPGLIGSMLARAEAQVSRLAFVYALLDGGRYVEPEHLQAAVAVWEYCEKSVEYVFGDKVGDPVADAILVAIRQSPSGLTRTQIRDFFTRNQQADRIDLALAALVRANLIEKTVRSTGGRPAEVWITRVKAKQQDGR